MARVVRRGGARSGGDAGRLLAAGARGDGCVSEVGALRLRPFAVAHAVPTFGCRVESSGGVWAYSADSAPCPGLVELARSADLFFCEAFRSTPGAGELTTVMTPEQAGEVAAAAGARWLVLTHLHPDADPSRALSRARSSYPGRSTSRFPAPCTRWEPGRAAEPARAVAQASPRFALLSSAPRASSAACRRIGSSRLPLAA
jgi:ribonuclease BN (tRNA processing enzyme)